MFFTFHKLYLIIESRMNPQHSTLEHIRHDETAEALQRGYDTIATETDTDASAPQACKPYCKAADTDQEYRLYLTSHHSWFLIAHFLKPRVTRILTKNALPAFT